ncbi:hypothetical protein Pelo_1171 [Pelomyxa schiedti]|nr:hypothetical protein Pelo_1171 [Pelomyxa schiedti]
MHLTSSKFFATTTLPVEFCTSLTVADWPSLAKNASRSRMDLWNSSSHKEAPRPVVTVALRARDQFLALATSTHPRCGSRSPPRALTQPLLRMLWDLCVASTERRLVIPVGGDRHNLVHHAGVSPLLLSVTPRGVVPTLEDDGSEGTSWADADHHIARRPGGAVPGYALRDMAAGAGGLPRRRADAGGLGGYATLGGVEVLLLEYPEGGTSWGIHGSYYCNRKWWCGLDMDRERMCLQSLVVRPMKGVGGDLPAPQSVIVGVTAKPESAEFLGMGKTNPDELLLLIRPGSAESGTTHEKRILVVDAQQTFSSGSLTVVCSVARDLPTGTTREGFILYTRTPGVLVCVLQVYIQDQHMGHSTQIFVVEMNPSGKVTPLERGQGLDLSRLSDSLFCISYWKSQYELWDCNDTGQPLRVVHTTAFVIGVDRGFLLQITEKGTNKEMSVVDALSGFVVLALEYTPDWHVYEQQHVIFVE